MICRHYTLLLLMLFSYYAEGYACCRLFSIYYMLTLYFAIDIALRCLYILFSLRLCFMMLFHCRRSRHIAAIIDIALLPYALCVAMLFFFFFALLFFAIMPYIFITFFRVTTDYFSLCLLFFV